MVGNAKSNGVKEDSAAKLTADTGVFSGLRVYLHDLIHMRALRRDLDKTALWGDGVDQEEAGEPTVLPLDVDRIQEIIAEEEQKTDYSPIFLSGLIRQKQDGDIGQKIAGGKGASQGLIDAERHFFRSLTAYEVAFKNDSFPLADILFRFAKLFSSRGHYDRASSYLQKAWSIIQKTGKQGEPDAGLILVSLVEIAHRCKNFFESDQGFYSLLELTEQRGGLQSPELGEALNGLANYFVSCSEYNKATLVFDRALNVFFLNRQDDHPVFIDILNSSGSMYYGLQIFSEAHQLYELAIRSIETHRLYDDYNTPILYHNSGLVCCHIKQMKDSRIRLVRSMITALQNGQEWVLWKSCYSLSYLFFQEKSMSGAMFFGKLAMAITLQSWQGKPQSFSRSIDPFLSEHMENLFKQADKEQEWEELQQMIVSHVHEQSETELEDSLQFFSAEERVHFQVFLLLSLQVKQIPITALTTKKTNSKDQKKPLGRRLKELEAGFIRLLARWDRKKKGRISI